MTVVEHLSELRRRIIISLIAVGLTAVIAYVFGQTGLMGDLSVQGSKITKLER